jgi:hypothetical protein
VLLCCSIRVPAIGERGSNVEAPFHSGGVAGSVQSIPSPNHGGGSQEHRPYESTEVDFGFGEDQTGNTVPSGRCVEEERAPASEKSLTRLVRAGAVFVPGRGVQWVVARDGIGVL